MVLYILNKFFREISWAYQQNFIQYTFKSKNKAYIIYKLISYN